MKLNLSTQLESLIDKALYPRFCKPEIEAIKQDDAFHLTNLLLEEKAFWVLEPLIDEYPELFNIQIQDVHHLLLETFKRKDLEGFEWILRRCNPNNPRICFQTKSDLNLLDNILTVNSDTSYESQMKLHCLFLDKLLSYLGLHHQVHQPYLGGKKSLPLGACLMNIISSTGFHISFAEVLFKHHYSFDLNQDDSYPLFNLFKDYYHEEQVTQIENFFHYLIQKGADIHFQDSHDRTVLFHAISKMYPITVLSQILEQGSRVDFEDRFGFTPLLTAAYHDYFESIPVLVEYGADINHINKINQTCALFLAIDYQNENSVHQLLQLGADVLLTNQNHQNALIWAKQTNRMDILNVLESHLLHQKLPLSNSSNSSNSSKARL